MEYRRANRGDIERFVENRVEFAGIIQEEDAGLCGRTYGKG